MMVGRQAFPFDMAPFKETFVSFWFYRLGICHPQRVLLVGICGVFQKGRCAPQSTPYWKLKTWKDISKWGFHKMD